MFRVINGVCTNLAKLTLNPTASLDIGLELMTWALSAQDMGSRGSVVKGLILAEAS